MKKFKVDWLIELNSVNQNCTNFQNHNTQPSANYSNYRFVEESNVQNQLLYKQPYIPVSYSETYLLTANGNIYQIHLITKIKTYKLAKNLLNLSL